MFIAPAAQAAPPPSLSIAAATKSCSTATAVAKRPTLYVGDKGSCISTMQQLLLAKGYAIGSATPDGWYGPKTGSAVKLFQKNNKLVQDKIVGPITWGALVKKAPAPKAPAILTFDDCPDTSLAKTNETLAAAQKQGVHFRLYVTGSCLKAKRFDVDVARKLGHTVCSHSRTHADLRRLSLAGVKKEMSLTLANGKPLTTNCGRPPYGATNATVRRAFKELGYSHDLWDVDTNDWTGKSQRQVTSYVISNTGHGDVVLMHMQWNAFNASAINTIKKGLDSRGIAVK